MIIAKNGTQYNEITNEIIKAHATYVNSPFVKVSRALNYRDVNGHKILVDDFTPEELKAGLSEIAKIADAQTRELYINKFFSSNKSEAQQIITRTLANKETYNKTEVDNRLNAKANANATVNLTGNQNIAGVKTFSSHIIIPNGTANNHAVNLAQLNTKANQATTYNKTEVDNRLREYSYSRTETYNKDQVNHLLSSVNNATYTKREVDDRINVKANWNAVVTLNNNQTIAGVKTFSSNIIAPNITTLQNQMNGLVGGGKSPYLLHDGVVRITVGNGGNFRNFTDALNHLKQNGSKQYIEIILTSDFNENIVLSDLPPCSINCNYRKLGNNLHIKNSPSIFFNSRDFSYSGTLTIENSNVSFSAYCNLRNKIIATSKSKVSFNNYTNQQNNILFLEAYDSSIFIGSYSVFKSDNTPCIVADDNSTIWINSYVSLNPANNHAAIVSKFGSLIICKGRFYRQSRGRYFAWVDNGGRIIGDLFGSNIIVNTARTNVAPNTWSPNGMILGSHWG